MTKWEDLRHRGTHVRFLPRSGFRYVAYAGHLNKLTDPPERHYGENLVGFLRLRFALMPHLQTSGPGRILFLADWNGSPRGRAAGVGFIVANGERITEWLPWLAYVAHERQLVAYRFSNPECPNYRGCAMAPEGAFTILERDSPRAPLAMAVLHLLASRTGRPGDYRDTILVAHQQHRDLVSYLEQLPGAERLPM